MTLSPSDLSTLKEIAQKLLALAERDKLFHFEIEPDQRVHKRFEKLDFDLPKAAVPTYPEGILSFEKEGYFMEENDMTYQKWVKWNLEAGRKIHSVRNSAGEVLTVGEIIKLEHDNEKIVNFYLQYNNIRVMFASARNAPINDVHPLPPKAEPPPNANLKTFNNETFKEQHFKEERKTEDGYAVGLNTWVYVVDKNFNLVGGESTYRVNSVSFKEDKMFVELKNAKEYIEENQPRFSKAQILAASYPATKLNTDNYLILDKQKLGL